MKRHSPLMMLVLACAAATAVAGPLDKTECIAPAKPGGGFDLTCKLAQSGLMEGKFIADPMRITYMPGGIGAVAYNAIVAQRPGEANTIVAFSGGSLLNLAQGKFGRYNENDVRWLAAVGSDFGAVIVAESSPFKSMKDLVAAVKADPTKVVFGAGGTVGSQDWMKAALTARAAGLNPKSMRFVAFEGGGEAITALQGGHVQVYSGDASEAEEQLKAGAKIRVLAVMSDKRLEGSLATIPTAKEQGFDIEWPIIRGFYLGPKVSDADYKVWADTFSKMMATPAFNKLRAERGLFPFTKTGAGARRLRQGARRLLPHVGQGLRPERRRRQVAPTRACGAHAPAGHQEEGLMSDRILGAACLVAGAGMAWAAHDYAAPISYEPVGPRAFPLLLAGLMALAGAWLVARPGPRRFRIAARANQDRSGSRSWRSSPMPRCSKPSASRSRRR